MKGAQKTQSTNTEKHSKQTVWTEFSSLGVTAVSSQGDLSCALGVSKAQPNYPAFEASQLFSYSLDCKIITEELN